MPELTDKQLNEMQQASVQRAELNALEPISYTKLLEIVDKWLLLKDRGVIKLLCSNLVTNKMPGDPVWLFLIAESGGGKTELINALGVLQDTYTLSSLTPATFISGARSKTSEPSLLSELGTGKTVLFKDFTSLLDGNSEDLKEIMGQLREIFDGHYTKRFGTGMEISWNGKMGMIACTTPMIEQRFRSVGAMGERFLNYVIEQPDRKEVKIRLRQNIGKEAEMRKELQHAFYAYYKSIKLPAELPGLPQDIEDKIDALADFVSFGRAVVFRDFSPKREIEYIAKPEMSTRVFKQLYATALGIYILNGNIWAYDDWTIIYKLGISSIHSIRMALINEIRSYKTPVKTSTMAVALSYPTTTIRRYLEDLTAIKILTRVHQGKGLPDLWSLNNDIRLMLNVADTELIPTKEDNGFDQDEIEDPTQHYDPEHERIYSSEDADQIAKNLSDQERKDYGLL